MVSAGVLVCSEADIEIRTKRVYRSSWTVDASVRSGISNANPMFVKKDINDHRIQWHSLSASMEWKESPLPKDGMVLQMGSHSYTPVLQVPIDV